VGGAVARRQPVTGPSCAACGGVAGCWRFRSCAGRAMRPRGACTVAVGGWGGSGAAAGGRRANTPGCPPGRAGGGFGRDLCVGLSVISAWLIAALSACGWGRGRPRGGCVAKPLAGKAQLLRIAASSIDRL
jgi:hypothetical protein